MSRGLAGGDLASPPIRSGKASGARHLGQGIGAGHRVLATPPRPSFVGRGRLWPMIYSRKRRERSAGRRRVESAPRSRRHRLLRFGRGIPPPHLSRGGGRCGGGRASRRSTAAPSFSSAPPLLPFSGSSRETPVARKVLGMWFRGWALSIGRDNPMPVIAGLDPAIHSIRRSAWTTGSSPVVTKVISSRYEKQSHSPPMPTAEA
jgi:hypothetical protein